TAMLETLADCLREPPTRPSNLPLNEFVYQSTFIVPDQPYGIRVAKVMQTSVPGLPQNSGLLLDIDAYTMKPIACDDRGVDEALIRLHWLKNKMFFSLLTDQAIQSFA